METTLVLGGAILSLSLVVMAIGFSLWSIVSNANKRAAATVGLCLWCAIAGATLTSALWSWMTTKNAEFQQIKIARLPPNSTPKDVNLEPMAMLKFYVNLDEFGRRSFYLAALIPLIYSIRYYRKTCELPAPKKAVPSPEDEFFSIEP